MQTKSKHVLGGVIFFFGIFIGLALALALIWEHYEAVSYFFDGLTYPAFGGLRCPILITRSEGGIIHAVFNNSTDQDDEAYYQMEIDGEVPRDVKSHFSLSPHTSETVQWTVDANDITLEFFIFAKLDVLPNAVHSTLEDNCGILVLNISSLNGAQIFWLMLILSLIGIPSGFALWKITNISTIGKALELQRAMLTLAILVPLSLFFGFIGWWFIGIIVCAIIFLLIVAILGLAIQ